MRLIVVSDIHGYYNEFVALLKKISYKKGNDLLIVLGDMIDRGPLSFKVMSLLKTMQEKYGEYVQIIKGNHEDMFVDLARLVMNNSLSVEDVFHEPSLKEYVDFTGDHLQLLQAYSMLSYSDKERYLDWIDSLPYLYNYNNHLFVHAALDTHKEIFEQNKEVLLWGYKDDNGKKFFERTGYMDKRIVFGHTPTSHMHYRSSKTNGCHEIWIDNDHNQDKIGIDCGIWKDGVLSALIYNEDDQSYNISYQERCL